MKKPFILIVAVIVLTGCQRTQWIRPNTTAQQFNADKYQCEIEALRMYPNTAGQPIGNPTYSTQCSGNYTGTSDGAIMLNCHQQKNEAPRSWIDTNSIPRSSMEEQCLRAKGYSKKVIGTGVNMPNLNAHHFEPSKLAYDGKNSISINKKEFEKKVSVSSIPRDDTGAEYGYQLKICELANNSYTYMLPERCTSKGGTTILLKD